MSADDVPTVPVTDGTIRLGQFLKLANLVDSGADARDLIAEGEVRVDGEVETRRGRQLSAGMLVEVDQPTGAVGARVG
ncbi:RNA-binding S4 domain-containing protein [Georgenia wangjunii]|uniref:RNA-binding S4 domain-containing protein n=1 Tax=Georgenia wangjunii TaxID=3117730 RepID=UPI002F263305